MCSSNRVIQYYCTLYTRNILYGQWIRNLCSEKIVEFIHQIDVLFESIIKYYKRHIKVDQKMTQILFGDILHNLKLWKLHYNNIWSIDKCNMVKTKETINSIIANGDEVTTFLVLNNSHHSRNLLI